MSRHNRNRQKQRQCLSLQEKTQQIVLDNLGLAYTVSQKYAALPIWEDVFQEACLALVLAAQYFDERRGYTFSTYAIKVMRRAIWRLLADQWQKGMATSCNDKDLFASLIATYRQMAQQMESDPTAEQVAERMGKRVGLIKRLLDLYETQTLSLEQPVFEEDLLLGETLPADPLDSPEARATENARKIHVRRLLADLLPEERTVICLRFGLGKDGREWTQEQVAEFLHHRRERVSALEQRALLKLQRSASLQGLYELLD